MPIDNIKRFLDKAIEISKLPEEETEVLDLELSLDTIGFIRGVAAAWHCTENDVIVATIMAILNEEPQKLKDLVEQ